MSIIMVLHEATRTGAPRVGGLIARELAGFEDVHVIVMKDGPLVPWLAELVGIDRLTVCREEDFSHQIPFDRRVQFASALLEERSGDVVYVNSLAASAFAFAANVLGCRVVLHVHEKAAEIYNLLRHDLTKIETMNLADGVVLAAEDLASDIFEVFGANPGHSINFGIAVDIEQCDLPQRRNQGWRGMRPIGSLFGVNDFWSACVAMRRFVRDRTFSWRPRRNFRNVTFFGSVPGLRMRRLKTRLMASSWGRNCPTST